MDKKIVVYDAKGAVLGRVGSFACKELLKGKEVFILNAEKSIITGKRDEIIRRFLHWRKLGGNGLKGPKVSRTPEKLMKRMIRGMLPWDRQKGRDAFKRLRCYNSTDPLAKDLKETTKMQIKKPLKYMTVEELCKFL